MSLMAFVTTAPPASAASSKPGSSSFATWVQTWMCEPAWGLGRPSPTEYLVMGCGCAETWGQSLTASCTVAWSKSHEHFGLDCGTKQHSRARVVGLHPASTPVEPARVAHQTLTKLNVPVAKLASGSF